MISKPKDLSIVVFTNRKDFFLAKLCIASIRFYYPDIKIQLVKDKLNGNFNTRRLRKVYNVQILKLEKRYYGWSAAKIHFLLNKTLPRLRYLCMDADIIFVGKVLEKIQEAEGDFVFNPQYFEFPFAKNISSYYLDPAKVRLLYPDYEYPGYFFNAGQTVVTPGLISKELLSTCFNPDKYPYYKNTGTFNTVDQSILNAVIPVLKKREKIEVTVFKFMILSPQFFEFDNNNNFQKFKDGKTQIMVHYAGDLRVPDIDRMKGNDLLRNFRIEYHSKLSNFQKSMDTLQDRITTNNFLTKLLYKRNRIWIEIINRLWR